MGTVLFILKNDKYRIDKAIKLKGKSKKIAIINKTVPIIIITQGKLRDSSLNSIVFLIGFL